jgi:hypothetical protein
MKKISIGIGLVALVVAAYFVYTNMVKPKLDNRTVEVVSLVTIENLEQDFAFSYPSGEAGYSVVEPPMSDESTDLIKAYILMPTKDYIKFQSEDAVDTPASLNVFVYNIPDVVNQTPDKSRLEKLRLWADSYPQFSSIGLVEAEPEQVSLDGVKGLRYETDGIYQQVIYLFSYNGRVYQFVGQFDGADTNQREVFESLVTSVVFY